MTFHKILVVWTLDFREIAKYFVDFRFRFRYFQKLTAKFWFLLKQIQNFKVSNLAMVKVKKVNIAVTYWVMGRLPKTPSNLRFKKLGQFKLLFYLIVEWTLGGTEQDVFRSNASQEQKVVVPILRPIYICVFCGIVARKICLRQQQGRS
jgi:hypothetical protein